MEGLRTLRNLSETTAPRRAARTREAERDQKVEGKGAKKKKRQRSYNLLVLSKRTFALVL